MRNARTEYFAKRRARLKAKRLCVSCSLLRAVKGRIRCVECLQKQKVYETFHRVRIQFQPPADILSRDELYKRAKSEREVVSWAWRNPA